MVQLLSYLLQKEVELQMSYLLQPRHSKEVSVRSVAKHQKRKHFSPSSIGKGDEHGELRELLRIHVFPEMDQELGRKATGLFHNFSIH